MYLTKFGKKILAVLVVLFAIVAIVGCTTTPSEKTANKELAEATAQEIYTNILWDKSYLTNVTAATLDLVKTTKYSNVTVAWTSSEPDVITSEGVVERPDQNDPRATLNLDGEPVVSVTLTAHISASYTYTLGQVEENETVELTKEFKFTVKCLNNLVGTIAEVKAAAWNYVYVEEAKEKLLVSASSTVFPVGFVGIVTAKLQNGGMGFMVHDGTEGIYVYSDNTNINVGDHVKVYGNIYAYYGSLQVGSEITVKKIEDSETEIGEYRRITVSEWEQEQSIKENEKDYGNNIGYFGGKLLEVYAKLEKGTSNSDIYKLVDPYDGEVAWVYYKSYVAGDETLEEFVGKYVYIRGTSYDRDSRTVKNHLLWDGTVEEAPKPELTSAQKMTIVKANLATLATNYVAGTKLVLPTADAENGATIAWALTPNDVLVNDKFILVENDTDVKAVATITIGDLTETLEVTLAVKKLTTYKIMDVLDLPKDTIVQIEGTVDCVFSKYNNFYIKDATGSLLVYKSLPDGVKLGDKISLVGAMGNYQGCPQIASITSTTLIAAGEWSQSAPTATTVADIAAINDSADAPFGEYLYATGVLVKDSQGYYFLADATDNNIKISLYNSTVTDEKLVNACTNGTEVTLFFYFYNNSKGDWTTGDRRVVFVQRAGEFFVGDEEVVLPRTYKYISEAKEAATSEGFEVVVRGIVSKVGIYSDKYNNFGALIEDHTGGLFLYRVAKQEAFDKLHVGDLVELKGLIKEYNGLYELTGLTADTITVVETGKDVSDPVAMSNDVEDQAKLVKLENALYDGKYFVKAGVQYAYYYSADWLAASPKFETGKYYTITGWLNWYKGAQITPTEEVVEVPESEIPAEELAYGKLATIELDENADADFTLPEGFTWTVVSGTGIEIVEGVAKVTRGEKDSDVVLKAELDGASKNFTVTVIASGVEVLPYKTIAEAKGVATSDGVDVVVRGIVSKVGIYSEQYNNFGALIEDATGALYLYRVTGNDAYVALHVGDLVDFEGTIKIYNGLYELVEVSYEDITVVETGKTVSAPIAMSNNVDDQSKLVKLENALYDGNGFVKAGVQYKYYYTSDWLATKPELVKGQYYTVTGWVNWYNAAQITPTEAVIEVAESEIPAIEVAQNKLAAVEVAAEADSDITLPEGFTWTVVSGTGIEIVEGVAKVTRGEADSAVVLKAELDGASREFSVKVLKASDEASTKLVIDFSDTNLTLSDKDSEYIMILSGASIAMKLNNKGNTSSTSNINSGGHLRLYKSCTLYSTAPTAGAITKIEINDFTKYLVTAVKVSVDGTTWVDVEFTNKTATVDSTKGYLYFLIDASANQARFDKITVTYVASK